MTSVTRSKRTGRIAALALALACGPAAASSGQQAAPAPPTASRAPDPCADAQTQLALTECADRRYREADAALDGAYGRLLTALDDPHRERLKAAQRAWLAFRDAECRLAASVALGGSMEPQLELACRKDMTEARVKELASIRESLSESMR
jgi:uncharacterized protein YecT (DUF1311 family)